MMVIRSTNHRWNRITRDWRQKYKNNRIAKSTNEMFKFYLPRKCFYEYPAIHSPRNHFRRDESIRIKRIDSQLALLLNAKSALCFHRNPCFVKSFTSVPQFFSLDCCKFCKNLKHPKIIKKASRVFEKGRNFLQNLIQFVWIEIDHIIFTQLWQSVLLVQLSIIEWHVLFAKLFNRICSRKSRASNVNRKFPGNGL